MTVRSLTLAVAVLAVASPALAGSRTQALADQLVSALDAGRADDGDSADLFARVAKSWAYQPETDVRDRLRLKAAVKAVRRLLGAPQAALSSQEFERAQALLEGVMGPEASKVMARLQQELFHKLTLVFAAARATGSDPVNKQPVTFRGKTYEWVLFNGRPILAEQGATLPTPKASPAGGSTPASNGAAENGSTPAAGGAADGGAVPASSGAADGGAVPASSPRRSNKRRRGHTHAHTNGASAPAPGGAPQPAGPSRADEALNIALYSDVDPRNLDGLEPSFREKAVRILRRLQAKGWQPRVASGRRTLAEQKEILRKGYSKTLKSWHLQGLAADIVDNRWGWGGPAADTNHPFWNDLGEAAAREGLTWGGNFKSFKDVAHVQDDGKNVPWPEATDVAAPPSGSAAPSGGQGAPSSGSAARPQRTPTGYERAAAARNAERQREERARRRSGYERAAAARNAERQREAEARRRAARVPWSRIR